MATRSFALTLVLLVGCRGASFEVNFKLPPDSGVTSLEVTVLEPRTADMTCDALAFGDVTPDAMKATTVQSVHVAPGQDRMLAELSSRGTKMIVVSAGDEGGVAFMGCGTIVDTTPSVLDISAEPVVKTSISPNVAEIPLPAAPPLQLSVTGTSVRGGSLGSVAGRWRWFGPSQPGASGAKEGNGWSTTNGVSVLPGDVLVTNLFGPQRVEVTLRWGTTATFTAMALPEPVVDTVARTNYRTARVGAHGERGLVAIANGGVNSSVQVRAPGSAWASLGPAPALSFDVVPELGRANDRLAILSQVRMTGRTDVTLVDPATLLATPLMTGLPPGSIVTTSASERCDSLAVLFHTADGGTVRMVETSGATVGADDAHLLQASALGAGGCLANSDGGTTWVNLAVTRTAASQALLFGSQPPLRSRAFFGFQSLVFLGKEDGYQMLVSQALAVSTVIDLRRLGATSDGEPTLETHTLVEMAFGAAPASLARGDFDGDGYRDTVAMVPSQMARGNTDYDLLMALGLPDGGVGAVASQRLATAFCEPELLAANLDAVGGDELLIVNAPGCSNGGLFTYTLGRR